METRYYAAVLYRGEEGYGVAIPDFPGCISYGETIQDAARQAEVALNGHVALMVRDHDPLPSPTPLDGIDAMILDPEEPEAGRFLVKVEIPARWIQVDLALAENLVVRVDHAARELGMSRSGFIAEATRRMLG